MKLAFSLQRKDIEEHYAALWKETGKCGIVEQAVNVVSWAAIAYVYVHFFGPIDRSHVVLFFVVLVATTTVGWLRTKRLRSKVVRDDANPALGAHDMAIDVDGITYSNHVSSGKILWQGIRRIEETAGLFQLYVSSFDAVLIPKRSVGNVEQFRQLIGELRENA